MNVQLFKQTLDYIKANPDKYNQHEWADYHGRYCFASTALILAGVWDGQTEDDPSDDFMNDYRDDRIKNRYNRRNLYDLFVETLQVDTKLANKLVYAHTPLYEIESLFNELN